MNNKIKYKFDCKEFHDDRRNYDDWRSCDYNDEDENIDALKTRVLSHLMHSDPKVPVEHHYQDYPALNVPADVDIYFNNNDGII